MEVLEWTDGCEFRHVGVEHLEDVEVIEGWTTPHCAFPDKRNQRQVQLEEMLRQRGVFVDSSCVSLEQAEQIYALMQQGERQNAQGGDAWSDSFHISYDPVPSFEADLALSTEVSPGTEIARPQDADILESEVVGGSATSFLSLAERDQRRRELEEMVQARGIPLDPSRINDEEADNLYQLMRTNDGLTAECGALKAEIVQNLRTFGNTYDEIVPLEVDRSLLVRGIQQQIAQVLSQDTFMQQSTPEITPEVTRAEVPVNGADFNQLLGVLGSSVEALRIVVQGARV